MYGSNPDRIFSTTTSPVLLNSLKKIGNCLQVDNQHVLSLSIVPKHEAEFHWNLPIRVESTPRSVCTAGTLSCAPTHISSPAPTTGFLCSMHLAHPLSSVDPYSGILWMFLPCHLAHSDPFRASLPESQAPLVLHPLVEP